MPEIRRHPHGNDHHHEDRLCEASCQGRHSWSRCSRFAFAPGTLAGWVAEKPISTETIRTGELSLAEGAETWKLNWTTISESALASTPLVPGDLLSNAGTFTPTIESDMSAELKLDSSVTTGLAASPVVAIDWALDGSKATQTLDQSDSGSTHTVQWQLQMASVGDPTYATGTEGQLQSLDLSKVRVLLTQK